MTEPAPIAFCITDLDRGGAESALVQVVTRLDRTKWSPTVYSLTARGELVDVLEAAGIPVHCFGLTRWNAPSVLSRLRAELARTRPVILQTFLYHANIAGRIAGWRAGVPHILSGIRVAEMRSRLRLRIDRLTERLVERHVCVSSQVSEFSRRSGLSPDKLVVIPNGIDLARFREATPADLQELGVPRGAFVILSVGRLEPQKAPDVLLEAAAPLLAERPEAHVMFVGDGPLRETLTDRADQFGIRPQVHLPGRTNDIPGVMKAAGCLALTSRWEGMPNVVLEAMGSELPIVCTAVEGIDDLLTSEETALITPIDDAAAVRSALQSTIDDRAKAAERARRAAHVAASWPSWGQIAQQFSELWTSLLPKPSVG